MHKKIASIVAKNCLEINVLKTDKRFCIFLKNGRFMKHGSQFNRVAARQKNYKRIEKGCDI
ncbi:hypothetical protein LH92_14175 [Acinetobacter baumannii]|nr:hypothetical protein LH92_14175 [Acinetobacter baumannii]